MKGFNTTLSSAFAVAARTNASSTISPWTCRRCLLQTQRSARTQRQYSTGGNGFPKSKSRGKGRVLLAAGSALGVSTAAVAFGDDVRHAYGAAERTGRVVGTLAVCINE